jgi:oxygen-independent coproporphyrinogen-3 oxidase
MCAQWNPPTIEDQKNYDPKDVFDAGEANHHISNTAYPIAHDLTWKPYRISSGEVSTQLTKAFLELDELNLYTHIPFCETRCYFCEYTVVAKKELDQTEIYMEALNRELNLYKSILGKRKIVGFDIGGGTPSFVDSDLIAKHIISVSNIFDLSKECEISIETTPKIASSDYSKLKSYFSSGIGRISMGLQVAEPNLLKLLGRSENGIEHHSKAIENMRRAGFRKINLDLMYGFAGQSLESWEHTLLHTISLAADYITLYRMRYKLTRISNQASQVNLTSVREQSQLAKKILADHGYFANPGKNTYSKIKNDTGTSSYLTRRVIQGKSYLGLGLGAQSLTDTSISYNSGSIGKNLAPYLQKVSENKLPIQDFYSLPKAHMMAKMIAVSFYFGEINLFAFKEKFGSSLEESYPNQVKFAIEEGLMEYTSSINGMELTWDKEAYPKDCLSLTPKGANHFNGVISLFFAPSVQNYLLNRDPNNANDFEKNQKLAMVVGKT